MDFIIVITILILTPVLCAIIFREEIKRSRTICKKCNMYEASEPHPCPYKEEIADDHTLCTGCKECEADCARDN